MEILVFGDSIAYGCWDDEGGWVARLRRYVDKKITTLGYESYYHHLYNLGIPGENTIGVLARFEAEVAARLRKHKDCAIIFAIGTNDSQFVLTEQVNRVPLEEFEQNIRAMITLARQHTEHIIFVGSLIADDVKMNPCHWAPEKAFITEYMLRYDAVVRNIAKAMSLQYIDVATPFIAAGGTALLDDGIHPTSEGHRIVFETVRDALVEKELI